MYKFKSLVLVVLISMSFAALATEKAFEGCWGFRQDGFPSSDATFKVTKIGDSGKFKVIIYNKGVYFTSLTATKKFEEGQEMGSSRGYCSLYTYIPQNDTNQPYSVTFDLHFSIHKEFCDSEDFEVPTGAEPEGYDTSRSLQLKIHHNQQFMIGVHTYEPVKTVCPENK